MGGEKYSKFPGAQFQIFQPRISLLLYSRHSIPLTTFLADARLLLIASLRLLYKNVCYTAGSRAFAQPLYTIHIDSLRQSLKSVAPAPSSLLYLTHLYPSDLLYKLKA